MPLLVRVLAGNCVTSAIILACLSTADVNPLRRTHPAVATTVAGVPWADTSTRIVDVARWRTALPAAVSGNVTALPEQASQLSAATAALAGVRCRKGFTDAMLLLLPPSLHMLKVHSTVLTASASFAHLPALMTLDCSGTAAVCAGMDRLPPSLCDLHIDGCDLPPTADFRHLFALQHLSCRGVELTVAAVASLPRGLETLDICDTSVGVHTDSTYNRAVWAALPPRLVELDATFYIMLSNAASFVHLQALRTLTVSHTDVNDASLACLPPSLVFLHMECCCSLTSAAVLPHLPALAVLDVSDSRIGDALVASLPPGLVELRVVNCRAITQAATLDHLPAL